MFKRKVESYSITRIPLPAVAQAMADRYPELVEVPRTYEFVWHVWSNTHSYWFGYSQEDDEFTTTTTRYRFSEREVLKAIGDIVELGSVDKVWTYHDDELGDEESWESLIFAVKHCKKVT